MKLSFIGLLTALLILPGSVFGAEIYSVQVGIYQKIKNAENQCQALQKIIEPAHLEALRVEKKGPNFAVRIGQFNQEKPARQLLSRIKKAFPQAFLWKGEYKKTQIVRRYGPASLREKKEPEFASSPSRPTYSSGSGGTRQEPLVPIPGKPPEAEFSPKGTYTIQGGKTAFPKVPWKSAGRSFGGPSWKAVR